ncbi:MAG: CHAT domain-containing protein [Gammaproteobacteria bacterium]|nr:CHAT domain-containing protein [Gammaproteobacteria bacterium]
MVNAICALEIAAPFAPSCDDAAVRLARARDLEPALASLVLANQSRRAQARRDPEAAYAYAVDALASAITLGTPDPQWRALMRLAELLESRGDWRLAIFFGKQAIVEIERLRGYVVAGDRTFERGFLVDKTNVYRSVADWLIGNGRIDEGIEVLSLLKTEELHDFILRDAPVTPGASALTFTPSEQQLLITYRAIRSGDADAGAEIDRLSRLREVDRISVSEVTNLADLLSQQADLTQGRAANIRAWIADAALASFTKPRQHRVRSKRIDAIRARFGDDTAFATYLLTDAHLRIIIATRNGVDEHSVPIEAATLRREIAALLDDIGARREVAPRARSLHDTLFAQVDAAAAAVGATRVVLWPDSALRYVPFAALYDGERYVADKYAVQIYAESTTAMPNPRNGPIAIRGLGVTRQVGAFRPLPAMADELCSIIDGPIRGLTTVATGCAEAGRGHGAVAGEGFVDAMFTEDRLKTILSDPQRSFGLLHLGTHFDLRPGNALLSSLLLGDGALLRLDDIARLDFRGLDLVTLSACQTGVGGAMRDDGREVEGLSTVVQRRGARLVVASLWSVEDVSTAQLMQRLYASMVDAPGDAALALSRASRATRSVAAYAHPYYWAGFFVSGDAR